MLANGLLFVFFLLFSLPNIYSFLFLFSFMLQKLFALVDETTLPDNEDALQNQEVLLPGHLIAIYLKVFIFLFSYFHRFLWIKPYMSP